MKQRLLSVLLAIVLLFAFAPQVSLRADAEGANFQVVSTDTGVKFRVESVGRYINWSGVSNASQFTDENGRFCFALDGDGQVTVYRTENGAVTGSVQINKPYPLFGGAICDSNGYLYLVWGRVNSTNDTAVNTIFLYKYDAAGNLVASAGGTGGEGLPYYYPSDFYTRIPFDGGNCDMAISGNLLCVNYAREMYNGHQSNGLLIVDKNTMKVQSGIEDYNSHSFDQRVTARPETGGFLLESHGDCYPRAFSTTVTNAAKSLNTADTFHFWSRENALSDWDMQSLNRTRARLGNLLETSSGAALIGASARSLSNAADKEPYDLFVQVFDPSKPADEAASYVTSGTRTGLAGPDGNEPTTDYGVFWLTDLSGTGKTIDVVQAVSIDEDRIGILYELSGNYGYDSTWFMMLNGDGSVWQPAVRLADIRLNTDEDPVFADGCVQWVSDRWNASAGSSTNALQLHRLRVEIHQHEYQAVVTEPTCTEQGYTTYTCACGDSYVSDYVAALGHDLVTDAAAVAPTCTGTGLTEGQHCTRCDYKAAQEEVPALGHDWDEGEITLAPTDTEKGEKTFTCSRCGATRTETVPELSHVHSYDAVVTDPTCTGQGYTTHTCECGDCYVDSYVSALGHDWDAGKVTTPATATKNGEKTFTCSRCGATRTETIPATGEPKNPFVDIGRTDYFYDAVLWAYYHDPQVTNGLDATHFGPYATCTRGQIVTFLWRALGEPAPTITKNPFMDVSESDYYYKAVLWAYEKGVTTGTDDTHFAPNDFCKREHAVAFLYRAAGKPEYTNKTNPFSDVSSSAYYYDAVLWAVEKNITKGMDATHFGPSNSCQRCQIVTFLYRFMNP